jgi:ribose 5-phosphate isomerase B
MIYIGSDHHSYQLKQEIYDKLVNSNYYIINTGCDSVESVDYPDYAHRVAKSVSEHESNYGILICSTSNGMAMTANKHQDVSWSVKVARLARQYNNANIICIPSDFVDRVEIDKMIDVFLHTEFESGRHQDRINKIVINN